MLQSLRKSKNANEKRQLLHNILNNSRLQTSLISRVFATHFEVGGLHASYERHFVKKIQQQLSYHVANPQFCICCFVDVFGCNHIILNDSREGISNKGG